MVEKLSSHELWLEFLEYKTCKNLLTEKEERILREYIENKKYLPMAERVISGKFHFSLPEKKEINKLGTTKKRVVYCFPDDENILLKMLSYLLYAYDNEIPDNCYSFRKDSGAIKAFLKMTESPDICNLYGFKADVSNYFNSIDVKLLVDMLGEIIKDAKLLELLMDLLCDDRAVYQGEIINEKRGVMAGTPTSPFFANLYLREMDEYFASQNAIYARYSDDILIFDTEENIDKHIKAFHDFMIKYKLESNPDKEQHFMPGDKWNFLGFDYQNGRIDVAEVAVRKLMDKIRRGAKSMRRWMLKKDVAPEQALRAFNRKFNRKFYDTEGSKGLCWCRWYFSVINTDESLHYIDRYMQDWQRYIVTGKHNKANYRKVPYNMLVENGYRPLVSEYYKQQK